MAENFDRTIFCKFTSTPIWIWILSCLLVFSHSISNCWNNERTYFNWRIEIDDKMAFRALRPNDEKSMRSKSGRYADVQNWTVFKIPIWIHHKAFVQTNWMVSAFRLVFFFYREMLNSQNALNERSKVMIYLFFVIVFCAHSSKWEMQKCKKRSREKNTHMRMNEVIIIYRKQQRQQRNSELNDCRVKMLDCTYFEK